MGTRHRRSCVAEGVTVEADERLLQGLGERKTEEKPILDGVGSSPASCISDDRELVLVRMCGWKNTSVRLARDKDRNRGRLVHVSLVGPEVLVGLLLLQLRIMGFLYFG